jgi:membrane dipeptidase
MSIHKHALVADLHCDTVLRLLDGVDIAVEDSSGHIDIPRLQKGGIDLQIFACWLNSNTPIEKRRPRIDEMIDTLKSQISRNPETIALCRNTDQAEKVIADSKIAAVVAIENGMAIAGDLNHLEYFYHRGVRYITLIHLKSSDWCASSSDTTETPYHGLSDFGREVVKKMNELGMIVDVSHASVAAVEEVLKVTTDPIIASHSCVHALCGHDRNLTDDQIKAIASGGGMIGINFFSGYLSQRWVDVGDSLDEVYKDEIEKAEKLYPGDYRKMREYIPRVFDAYREARAGIVVNIATVVDHIDYIVNLVGPDYVGLGSDFDGVHRLPDSLKDCSMMPNITKELLARGYLEEDIVKILGGNFMRIFKRVCG